MGWLGISLVFHVSGGEKYNSLDSIHLWCMMYAQKVNPMFIHDFQGNAFTKLLDFLLTKKTTWDWDFSFKAYRPSCSFDFLVSFTFMHWHMLSYLLPTSFSFMIYLKFSLLLSKEICLTLRKSSSYFLLILLDCLLILLLHITKNLNMNLDLFFLNHMIIYDSRKHIFSVHIHILILPKS